MFFYKKKKPVGFPTKKMMQTLFTKIMYTYCYNTNNIKLNLAKESIQKLK